MTHGISTDAEAPAGGTGAPNVGPLVTGSMRTSRWATHGPVSIPPLRAGSGYRRATGADLLAQTPAQPDWRDESPSSALGEAEPEDELPFLREDTAFAMESAAGASLDGRRQGGVPARAEEIADRLESIARALRDKGPAGLLLTQGRDPLGALITGYLVGYLEAAPPQDPDASS